MANNNFLKLNDSVETIVIEDKIFFVDYDHGKVSYILHNNQEKNYKELLGSIDNDTISMLTQSGFIASNEEPKIVLNREHILRDFANKSDLLHYILLPSEDCNFRCTYCYE